MQKKKPVVYSLVNNGLVYFSGFNYTRAVPHSLFTRVNERHHHACMLKFRIINSCFVSANITGRNRKSKYFRKKIRHLYITNYLFAARLSRINT